MIRIFLLLFLAVFCLAKDISVATYNVENLFDDKNNGHEYKDYKISKFGWNKQKARKKFENTIKAIKFINADIIALQEVENKALVQKMAQKLNYKYFAFSKPLNSPFGLGVMSKYKIISQQSIYAGIKKTRDFLNVVVSVDDKKLGLWIVHFPTQKYGKQKRLKVAHVLKQAILNSKQKEYLILGDFNTKISNNSILAQTFGSLSNKQNYYDPWLSLPHHERYSHKFFNHKSALDRIILSKNMFDNRNFEYKNGSFKVVKGFLANFKGEPNRWNKTDGYSDHFPILLTLSLDKANFHTTKKQKELSIDKLYELDYGSHEVLIKDAVVIYKSKNGIILSQKGRGIYAYRCGYSLKKGYSYDILVKNLMEYRGLREISELELIKENKKVQNLSSYFSSLNDFDANSVISSISGVYKNNFLYTNNGKIRLYSKKRLKEGSLKLKQVRVGLFKGDLELVVEERE